jgi:hypothetical protein
VTASTRNAPDSTHDKPGTDPNDDSDDLIAITVHELRRLLYALIIEPPDASPASSPGRSTGAGTKPPPEPATTPGRPSGLCPERCFWPDSPDFYPAGWAL